MQYAHRPTGQLKLYRKAALRVIVATIVPLTQKCRATRVPERASTRTRRRAGVFSFSNFFHALAPHDGRLTFEIAEKRGNNAARQRANGRGGYFISLSESDARWKLIIIPPRYSCLSRCRRVESSRNVGEGKVVLRIGDEDV